MTDLPMAVLGMPGGYEWILILIVVLVLFGNRIPGVARSLGSGISEFKKGLHDGESGKTDKPEDRPGKSAPPAGGPGRGQESDRPS